MKQLVTKNHLAKAAGTTRHRIDKMVEAGVLPPPTKYARLWHWPTVAAAMAAAGIPVVDGMKPRPAPWYRQAGAGLGDPAARDTKG